MLCACLLLLCSLGGDAEADQFFPLSGDYAASHILVAWKGADKARGDVRRSKAEAREKALRLSEQLRANPEAFEQLAHAHSDGVTASIAGYLGAFPKGRMDRAFEAALRKLEVGEIQLEPVKTPFGYHLIRRESMMAKRYAARVLVLSHMEADSVRGLKPNAVGLTRTKGATQALVAELALKPESFYAQARELSDLQKVFLGVFREGDGPFTDRVILAVQQLAYEEISQPLEWNMGYVFLQRLKVERRSGSRIYVAHTEAEGEHDSLRRKSEAREIIDEVYRQLQADPSRFEALARTYSDDAGAVNGGKMAAWYVGYQDYAVEQRFASLAPGQVSEPVDAASGFYILRNDAEVPDK